MTREQFDALVAWIDFRLGEDWFMQAKEGCGEAFTEFETAMLCQPPISADES